MNILGIGSHPDDLEVSCGGTLAKYAKQGHKVFMCNIANGDMGHMIYKPPELREIRRKEAIAAAAVLGAESFTVDVGDTMVEASNKETRDKLIEIVRYTKPNVIITHNPADYMRDHEQAGLLAVDATFCCTLPNLVPDVAIHPEFPPVFYMDTLAGIGFVPSEYVDITEEIEQKLEALSCHESQVKWMLEHDHIDFLDFVRTCNKYRGLQSNCLYAEGFSPVRRMAKIQDAANASLRFDHSPAVIKRVFLHRVHKSLHIRKRYAGIKPINHCQTAGF